MRISDAIAKLTRAILSSRIAAKCSGCVDSMELRLSAESRDRINI